MNTRKRLVLTITSGGTHGHTEGGVSIDMCSLPNKVSTGERQNVCRASLEAARRWYRIYDANVIAAAIRECREETGIHLLPTEFPFHFQNWRENGAYRPHFCIARVTEEKLDTRLKFGDENGRSIMVAAFGRAEVLDMIDVLEHHRPFLNRAMTA